MTRHKALKNLLKCVFGNCTLSVENGEIVKGISLLSNCNYTVRSFNNFKRLFEVAFIVPCPKYSDQSDFDRKQSVLMAKEYLLAREIDISEKLPYEKQCKIIFDILVEYFLYTIVVDKQGDNKTEAKEKDITFDLDKAIEQAKSYFTQKFIAYDPVTHCDNDSFSNKLVDTDLERQSNNSNYHAKIDCSQMESYSILMLLRNLYLTIPLKDGISIEQDNNHNMSLKKRILSGEYTGEMLHYQCFPIDFFPDSSKLFQYMEWETYINVKDIISQTKSSGIRNVVNKLYDEIVSRATEQVEKKLNEELKPFYENNRKCFEKLITSLISLKDCKIDLNDSKVLTNQETMKEFLLNKCEQIFRDFERPYMIIEQTYHDNIAKGLYISIQNTIIELTELLNENGIDIARQFKIELTTDSFRKHKNFINKTAHSEDLEKLIKLEKKLEAENESMFSKPTLIRDFSTAYERRLSIIFNPHCINTMICY